MKSPAPESKFDWIDKRVRLLAAAVAATVGIASFFAGGQIGERQAEQEVEKARELVNGAARLSAGKAEPAALARISEQMRRLVRDPATGADGRPREDQRILSGSFWVPEHGGRALTEADISLNVTEAGAQQVWYQVAGSSKQSDTSRDVRLPPPKDNCILNLVTPITVPQGEAGGGAVFRLSCSDAPAPGAPAKS